MQKLAKKLSVLMAVVMTLSVMLNFVMFAPMKADAATIYPQVQYVTEPKLEYEAGDIVNFDLNTPNYGGRVQYRVVLWDNNNKTMVDLWKTPDRFYTNWMPYGNETFNLHWRIDQPGSYRITIYVKRAGVPNNETYLKGFNCDSYMESDAFTVKAKEVAQEKPKPDVPAESLKLDVKSTQMVVGQEYTVKADVKKAGVKVIFLVDAPADSLNKDVIGEAMSDSNGIATYKYTRTYADADYVTAFSAAAPAIRDAQKVYWGVKPILTVTAMDKDDAASIVNGGVKQYKVKLVNPLTGEPMKYKEVKVMLKENIDTPTAEVRSTATVTNGFNNEKLTPYQRLNNIVPGGLNEVSLALRTNDNGEATFTLTGYNTKATPIVYYDDPQFFNESPALALFRWSGQLPTDIGVPDTSQYAPVFAGNNNNRLEATELQATVKTVSFDMIGYTFEYTMDGTKYVAIDNDGTLDEGRIFTVTVKKPDGTAFARGTMMVRLEELFDNTIANDCDARLVALDSDKEPTGVTGKSLMITLNGSGKASFMVSSDTLNDIATPRVWIDQDTRDPHESYSQDLLYTQGEPTKVLDTLYFADEAVTAAGFDAYVEDQDLEVVTDDNDYPINIGGYVTNYEYSINDQNNELWLPDHARVYLTYTLKNEGSRDIIVYRPNELQEKEQGYDSLYALNNDYGNIMLNRHAWPVNQPTYTLKTNETITIAFTDDDHTSIIQASTPFLKDASGNIIGARNGKLSVQVHAVTTRSHELDELQWNNLDLWSLPWFQPSNTTDAIIGDDSITTSWIAWQTYADYTLLDVALRGKVVAFDRSDEGVADQNNTDEDTWAPNALGYGNFVVIDNDNDQGVYTLIGYSGRCKGEEYFLSFPAARDTFIDANEDIFERQLTLEDYLYYAYSTKNHMGTYKLYNADNSNEVFVPVVPTISALTVKAGSVVGVTEANAQTPNTTASAIKIDGQVIVFSALPTINANAGNDITVTVRQNDSDNLNITATANTVIITLANTTASKNTPVAIENAIKNLGIVGGTDYTKMGVLMGQTTYTGSTGSSIANPTAQLSGGKVAVAAVVGKYEFTLNKVLSLGQKITIGEFTYTAGLDFIVTTSVSDQATSLALAIKAKDARFTGTTATAGTITLLEGTPSGKAAPVVVLVP